jgi:hypothetical protein
LPYQQILSRSRRTVKRIGERCISAVFSVNHAALRNLYTSVRIVPHLFLMERSGLHSNRSANLEKLSDSPNSRRWGVSIAGQRGWCFNRTQSKLIKPFAIHYW